MGDDLFSASGDHWIDPEMVDLHVSSRITTIEQLLFDTESNLLEKVYQAMGGHLG